MNSTELRQAGFDVYGFTTRDQRLDYKVGLEASSVTFEFVEGEDTVESKKTKGLKTTFFLLGAKRTSPTLKQLLTKAAEEKQ